MPLSPKFHEAVGERDLTGKRVVEPWWGGELKYGDAACTSK